MGPNVSMGMSYDTMDVLRQMLVVATSYNGYQAKHGEAACLAVLKSARAWWSCNLCVHLCCIHVCCDLLGRQALTRGRGEAELEQDFCANILGAKQHLCWVGTDRGAAPAEGR